MERDLPQGRKSLVELSASSLASELATEPLTSVRQLYERCVVFSVFLSAVWTDSETVGPGCWRSFGKRGAASSAAGPGPLPSSRR